jgi:hypothetical protein
MKPVGRFSAVNLREMVMSDPSGWLWVMIGVFGIGGLGVALAYGNSLWSRKRMDAATRDEQEKTVRDNYRQGG